MKANEQDLNVTKILWQFPRAGWVNYNSDGASKGNLGIISYAYYLRDERGDLIYVRGTKIEDTTNVEAEAYAMLQAIIHCSTTQYDKIIFQTDSLTILKIVTKEWKCPWNILQHIEQIWSITSSKQIEF